jgi:hypothetical protein
MFNWLSQTSILAAAVILVLVQFLAALPWLNALSRKAFRESIRTPATIATYVLGLVGVSILVAMFLGYRGESDSLKLFGRAYAFALHVQLILDFFIVAPALLTWLWPKGGAVALATFREGWRQPMFWLLTFFGMLAIAISIVVPYYTFGDDYKFMKSIGYDFIMLFAALFGVLASSISISEEIEGRTAVTLMSKPVNRRHFLIGKFLGILLACFAMTMILLLAFVPALWVMPAFDKINTVDDSLVTQTQELLLPSDGYKTTAEFQASKFRRAASVLTMIPSRPGKKLAEGIGLWFSETFAHGIGVILGFGQVSILVAIATALATRLPFVVNLVISLFVYFAGNLAPVIVRVTQSMAQKNKSTALDLVNFMGKMSDAVLPAFEHFKMNTAIIRETPLELDQFFWYVLTVCGYSAIYTGIAILVGLILFEDRDLA